MFTIHSINFGLKGVETLKLADTQIKSTFKIILYTVVLRFQWYCCNNYLVVLDLFEIKVKPFHMKRVVQMFNVEVEWKIEVCYYYNLLYCFTFIELF